MSEIIIVILILVVISQRLSLYQSSFKIGYYEQKLENRGIRDSVKDMPWWKLWL